MTIYTATQAPSSAPLIIHIVVVGAGIGGLVAAHALALAGHQITILESAHALGEVGAGVVLGPNATRLLFGWGLGPELNRLAVQIESLCVMRGDTGEQVGYQLYGKTMEKECGAPLLTVHRADLHNMLVTLVQSSEKVKIRLNSRVKSVDADSPSATLESGEVVHGDLIIGADGIRSYIRDVVLGEPTSVIPTGTAIYRGLISASRVLADPDLRSIIEKPELCAWRGSGRSLITYPVRNCELLNFGGLHPDDAAIESWTAAGDVEEMKSEFADFEPRVHKLLSLATSITKFRIMDRDPLTTWTHSSGRVTLLGDACHPMLPTRAQGASMAIEDAAVLGTLFTYVASLAHIAPLLEAYESIRLPRATEAQLGSRVARDRQHLADPEAQRARDEEDKAAMEAELRKAQAVQQGASEGEALKPAYASEGDGKPSHDSRSHFVGDVRAEAVQWWDTKGRALLSELS